MCDAAKVAYLPYPGGLRRYTFVAWDDTRVPGPYHRGPAHPLRRHGTAHPWPAPSPPFSPRDATPRPVARRAVTRCARVNSMMDRPRPARHAPPGALIEMRPIAPSLWAGRLAGALGAGPSLLDPSRAATPRHAPPSSRPAPRPFGFFIFLFFYRYYFSSPRST